MGNSDHTRIQHRETTDYPHGGPSSQPTEAKVVFEKTFARNGSSEGLVVGGGGPDHVEEGRHLG